MEIFFGRVDDNDSQIASVVRVDDAGADFDSLEEKTSYSVKGTESVLGNLHLHSQVHQAARLLRNLEVNRTA